MKLATLIHYLRAHRLPWTTRAQRRASVTAFQRAFTWWALTIDGDAGPLTHDAFRHAAKYGHRVSAHFGLSEFQCGCQGRYHHRLEARATRALILALERARTVYGGRLTIVSGWRCPRYNAAVGGKHDSEHLAGRAADIPARHSPATLTGLGFHGLGYKSHGFVTHVDVDPGMKPNTPFLER